MNTLQNKQAVTLNLRRHRQRVTAHLPYIIGVTIVALVFFGTSLNGFIDTGHDSLACVVRYIEYRDEIAAGYWQPQLFNSVILGATHAFPVFYPPMGYIVALLAGGFVHDPVWAVNISFFLSILLSTYSAYYMGFVASNKRWGGVLAALVLTTATYRFVNCYVRGALAESWVLVFLPLILAGIIRLMQGKRAWGLISIGVAGALLSHLVMMLWFGPLLLLANLPIFLSKGGWRGVLQYAVSGGLGFGLTLWFLIPQQALLPEVHASDVKYMWGEWKGVVEHRVYFSQLFDLTQNAWSGGSEYKLPYIHDTMSFHLGTGGVLGALALVLILLKPVTYGVKNFTAFTNAKVKPHYAAATLIAVSALCWLFYMLVLTRTEWFDWLPTKMGYLQFPWRLLGLLAVFHAFFLAYALAFFPKVRRNTGMLIGAAVLILATVPSFVSHRDYRLSVFDGRTPETLHSTPLVAEDFRDSFESRVGGTSIAEYTNKGFPVMLLRKNWRDFQLPEAGLIEGNATILARYIKPGLWEAEVQAQEASKVFVPTIYYSFWRAEDATGKPVTTFASNGFLGAEVEAGITTITFKRIYPAFYTLGWALSFISVIVLLVLMFTPWRMVTSFFNRTKLK